MTRLLNWTLNLIAIMSAVVIISQLWRQLTPSKNAAGPEIGARVPIDGGGSNARLAVVLGLSPYCTYCRGSASFYRTLLDAAHERSIRVVTVLPPSQGQDYKPLLPALGLTEFDTVSQVDLGSLGVRMIPTILLIDQNSTVRRTWAGKLSEAQEREIFLALGLSPRSSPKAPGPTEVLSHSRASRLSAQQVKAQFGKPDFIMVDTRPRSDFVEAHIEGAVSIRIDEFEIRAPHELPRDQQIAIICPDIHGVCDSEQRFIVESMRFKNVQFVPLDLCAFQADGIPMHGDPRCRLNLPNSN